MSGCHPEETITVTQKEFTEKMHHIAKVFCNFEKAIEKIEADINILQKNSVTEMSQDDLFFEDAMKFLRNGKKIGCWHRDDIFVYLDEAQEFRVKTINGDDCPWMPNQQELLTKKWRVING